MSKFNFISIQKSLFLVLLAAVTMGMIIGCKRDTQPSGDKILYVVTTTGMLADAVQSLGGKALKVEGLMSANVDPHVYKATAADMRKLAQADLLIYNGLQLEGKFQEILERMARTKKVIAATAGIPRALLIQVEGMKDVYDPHVWFDASLWQQVVRHIGKSLIELDPKHKELYMANLTAYTKRLEQLHNSARTQIAQIPKSNRYLVTSHDSFGYFGRAYDIQVMGLQGISTVTEAGLRDKERLVDFLVKNRVPAIFAETSVSDKGIRSVIESSKSMKHQLTMGENLYSDAMGEAGTPEGTYVGMMEHNVRAIVKALSKREAK
jgi:manganese/zinc/iron transport system substrate-binding protein